MESLRPPVSDPMDWFAGGRRTALQPCDEISPDRQCQSRSAEPSDRQQLDHARSNKYPEPFPVLGVGDVDGADRGQQEATDPPATESVVSTHFAFRPEFENGLSSARHPE